MLGGYAKLYPDYKEGYFPKSCVHNIPYSESDSASQTSQNSNIVADSDSEDDVSVEGILSQ